MDNRNTTASAPGEITRDGVVNTVKERATAKFTTQKGRALEGLDVVAQAVRQTTQHLRDSEHHAIAQYVERAVEQVERLSNSVRDKDLNDLMRDARQLARRQPALFIGGSFLVGMLAARFLKSSGRNGSGSEAAETYRSPMEGGSDARED